MRRFLRLLVADDHDLVRKGVRALLEDQPGWHVVAEASNGREAVDKATAVRPDVAILDLNMPELDGIDAAREILTILPTKVVILTIHDSDLVVQRTIATGIHAYVLKSDAERNLVLAIEALCKNKTFFTPQIAEMILEGYVQRPTPGKDKELTSSLRLTARQYQILQLLAQGKSSKEAAAVLDISVKTAETHRANIMRRLNCHSLAHLVRYAIHNCVIDA